MNKKLYILIFCFFTALPLFSESNGAMYKLLIENYRTRNTVELVSPEKEIIKNYIDKLDAKKDITIFKMPIEYFIVLKYKDCTLKYCLSGDGYLENDDNYAIIVDDKFKKLIENLDYSECLQNEIKVFGNNFINFTIDKLSK